MNPITFYQGWLLVGLLGVILASDRFAWRFTLSVVLMVCAVQMAVSGGRSPVLAPTHQSVVQTSAGGV